MKDKFRFEIADTMGEMGLKILEKGVDFFSFKPDMVAVYVDKLKYYIIEPMSEGCFSEDSPRIYTKDSFEEYRLYCKKLFPEKAAHASVAATVICDLAGGVDAFDFKSIGSLQLNSMDRYGCLAVPCHHVADLSHVLNYLKIAHQDLNILDRFSLVLISKKQTELLSETKKFIKFILGNK